MSRGKYSPILPSPDSNGYVFNCHGQVPAVWDKEVSQTEVYDEKIHFPNYDINGFDSYGYSAFDIDKNYVGIGSGVDRNGITEMEYCCMSEEEFVNL